MYFGIYNGFEFKFLSFVMDFKRGRKKKTTTALNIFVKLSDVLGRGSFYLTVNTKGLIISLRQHHAKLFNSDTHKTLLY